MKEQMKKSGLLLFAAMIWGFAFVAQSTGGDEVGAYTFNCLRSLIGSFVLLPVVHFMDTKRAKNETATKKDKRMLLKAGIFCGLALSISSNLQQVGITLGTPAGKAGFLTTCYILLVPILGIFLKKKCSMNIWIGVGLSLVGLYLLCMSGSLSVGLADGLLLLCALGFSIHILVVDHFSPLVDGVKLSCIQFLVSGIISAIPMFFVDMKHSVAGMASWVSSLGSFTAWVAILYAGVLSCGVAYTLQIIGQNGLNPTIASLLMSFESVFSVIGGFVILHEALSLKELAGCALIFVAVIIAQLPVKEKREQNTRQA